jgi:hypothetical protein
LPGHVVMQLRFLSCQLREFFLHRFQVA